LEHILQELESKVFITEDFVCPLTNVPLSVKCGLNECEYCIDNVYLNGCALNYMHKFELNKLSEKEISFLYKDFNIKQIIDNISSLIRSEVLIKGLENNDSNKITYVKSNYCCVCNSKTNNKEEQFINLCSTSCKRKIPKFVFELEIKFGYTISSILKIVFSKFSDISIIESVLGINKKQLEFVIKNLVPEHSNLFHKLIKRTSYKPKASKNVVKTIESMEKRIKFNQFGESEISLSAEINNFINEVNN